MRNIYNTKQKHEVAARVIAKSYYNDVNSSTSRLDIKHIV